MELPNSPFHRRSSAILAGVIGLAAIMALFGWRGLQVATPATTVTSVPSTTLAPPSTTSTLPPTSSETTSRPDEVLWHRQGSDVEKSPLFIAPGAWRIVWTFDCSNFEQLGSGNFKITGDGAFERIQIERVAIRASGSRTLTRGGYGHLLVESVCDRWTVTALAG